MICPPASPTFTPSRAKPHTENDSPTLSPKRSFAQLGEDPLPQPGLKRRDVQSSKRAPLDPLSASDLENRRSRNARWSNAALHHSNTLVAPSADPDLRVLLPKQPVSSGACGMQRSGVSDALVRSWPPPVPTPGTARSSHSGLVGPHASHALHSLVDKMPSRATLRESNCTAWNDPDTFQVQPTPTVTRQTSMLQPIRSRTTPLPSVRRPPGELWRSESGSTGADPKPVDTADPFVYPPGLSPRRSELGRSSSSTDLLSHGSVSLSLAHGSQPLRASEHTKAVPPIGAERRRIASITSLRSHMTATQSHDPSRSPWSPPSPELQAKWKNEVPTSLKSVPAPGTSKEDLERLLRHASRNKYSPKIVSPLSPLRSATPALNLSADPIYQARMPSQLNSPSPRYAQCPPRRVRTICEGYQSLDWNATCVHCQACKRDTIGKRLLALRYRQLQRHHVQRHRLIVARATTSVMNDDRIVLANRIREAFAYEMDDEEKSLWEEVAAATGAGPVSISRARAPCAVAHRSVAVDGSDDRDDYPELLDEGFLANESATLFREVSAY